MHYPAEAMPCRMAYARQAASVWISSFSGEFLLVTPKTYSLVFAQGFGQHQRATGHRGQPLTGLVEATSTG